MPLAIPIFLGSLFLTALFLAVKEREVYGGTQTFLTRFLVRWSPRAQAWWEQMSASLQRAFGSLSTLLMKSIQRGEEYVVWTVRFVIVLLAEKMIKAVKGEKLLVSKGAPSLYLKRIKEHGKMNEE